MFVIASIHILLLYYYSFADVYNAFHPPSASDILEKKFIGVLDASDKTVPKTNEFEKEYREMTMRFKQQGLYKAKYVIIGIIMT